MARRDAWHPWWASVEDPVGVWTMWSPQKRAYGQIVAVWDEKRYRVHGEAGGVIGHTTSLMEAVEIVHRHYVLGHSPSGAVNGDGNTGGGRRMTPPEDPKVPKRGQ